MNSSNRIVFGSETRDAWHLLPEVLEAGWGHFSAADSGHLRPHRHKDAFEFCLILSGEVEWDTANSSDILREGDVYLTQPDELHWGKDTAMHPCTLHWLIVGAPSCGFEWSGIDPELAAHIDSQIRQFRTHCLRGTSKLSASFREVFDEHANDSGTRQSSMLSQGNARAALHGLLIGMVRAHDRQGSFRASGDEPSTPQVTTQAIATLHSNAHEPDAARRACQSIGMDYKTLNREFVKHLGTTISQYWLRERVRLAREQLLQTDATVTGVATQLGFSSSQHFATVFRKVTGLTPSDYRNAGKLDPCTVRWQVPREP